MIFGNLVCSNTHILELQPIQSRSSKCLGPFIAFMLIPLGLRHPIHENIVY